MYTHRTNLAILISIIVVLIVGGIIYILLRDASSDEITRITPIDTGNTSESDTTTILSPTASSVPVRVEHPLATMDRQRVSDVERIRDAIEAYHAVHGIYFSYGSLYAKLGTDESSCFNAEGFQAQGCDDPYMADVPADPGIHHYWYQSIDGNSYILRFAQDGVNGEFVSGLYHLTPDGYEPYSINTYEPSAEDSDGDGLSDIYEQTFGTDPYNIDTDGDGYDDFTEVLNGLNPLGSGALPYGDQIREMFRMMDGIK